MSAAAIRDLCAQVEESEVEGVVGFASAERDASVVTAASPGVEVVCRHDRGYPCSLLDLEEQGGAAPALVHSLGGADRLADLLAAPCVTIVGARRASAYALRTAHEFGRGLAAAGVTVVSGLALGVDAAAHAGAIEGGGRSLAVVAGGVDVPYPRSNARLRKHLLETGAVVSEMPVGTPSYRWGFPARNRLMAAFGAATLVIEAGARSGTLITVRAAQALNRSVLVVPGRVDSALANGSNGLLREACVAPVLAVEDVLDELYGVGYGPRPEPRDPLAELDPIDRSVFDALAAGGGGDGLAGATGHPAGIVRAALGRLELAGHIARDGLGWRVRGR